MPIIFCSLKLSKLAGIKTRLPSISMDNWNGHLFALQGRKCLVFVHKETYYSVVIFDILKKDLLNFKQLFIDSFLNQLKNDNLLNEDLQLSILIDFQNLEFSTTDGDHSTIGYLNDCIARLTYGWHGRPPSIEETKYYVENHYNNNPLLSRNGSNSNELMREKLKSYTK